MRLRVEYSLSPGLKFLSNLEMMRLMERSLRRSSLPYALTEGFNPHIKMSLGTVLPVGVWGVREYMDVELTEEIEEEIFINKFNAALPPGIKVNKALPISDKASSLMKIINAASYTFVLKKSDYDLESWKQQILQAESLKIKSRGKKKDVEKDIKAGIYKIEVNYEKEINYITIWVSVGDPVNVRYDELYDLLTDTGILPDYIIDIYRSGNYIKEEEFLYTPLEKVI